MTDSKIIMPPEATSDDATALASKRCGAGKPACSPSSAGPILRSIKNAAWLRSVGFSRGELYVGATSRAIGRTPHHRKSVMAFAAVGRRRVLHRLYRPQQHLGCRADHEQGSGLHRLHLRLGRWHLLLRLFP